MFFLIICNFWIIHKLHYKVSFTDTVYLILYLRGNTGKYNITFYESYESLFSKPGINLFSELRSKDNITMSLIIVTEWIYFIPGTTYASPYFTDKKFETRK